jgi:hypothetical protein
MLKDRLSFALLILVVLVLSFPAAAQDMAAPQVNVADQVSVNGMVTIDSAYSAGPGFVVIHIDNEGAPGPVAGFRWLNTGWNYNVQIRVDNSLLTPTLFAMLHVDDNEVGTYEFGTVDGADAPVAVDGNVVTPSFKVDAISPTDQFVSEDGMVTFAAVTVQVGGWLVIHSDNDGAPGSVLGQTQIPAGTSNNVAVQLAEEGRTDVLFPMLHVDTGAAGTYEFGTVEGADGPVVVNGAVATMPIWTVPHIRVMDQIVLPGDGMEMGEPTAWAMSVLSDGPGFLVFHQEQDGSFGPVAGVSDPLPAGLSTNVVVTLDPAMITPVLWPMLHVDTGEAGVYEFGTVEGADGPVVVGENVVTYAINAAPSIVYEGSLTDGQLTVKQALIDAPGWLVIHANDNGNPGAVLGQTPIVRGLNSNIVVEIDPAMAGDQVFPMLHYDTGTAGVYEFGTVEGADGVVFVGEAGAFGPMATMGG